MVPHWEPKAIFPQGLALLRGLFTSFNPRFLLSWSGRNWCGARVCLLSLSSRNRGVVDFNVRVVCLKWALNPVLFHVKQIRGVFSTRRFSNSHYIPLASKLTQLKTGLAMGWDLCEGGERGLVTSRCGIRRNSLGFGPWIGPPFFLQWAGKIPKAGSVSPWHWGVSQELISAGIPDRAPLFGTELCQGFIGCCGIAPFSQGCCPAQSLTFIPHESPQRRKKKNPEFLMMLIIVWEQSGSVGFWVISHPRCCVSRVLHVGGCGFLCLQRWTWCEKWSN